MLFYSIDLMSLPTGWLCYPSSVVQYQVTAWGMQCDQVASGPEALTALRHAVRMGCPYHLAILDMQMPEMDGLLVAQAIKDDPPLAPTVLVMLTSLGQLSSCDQM